MNNKGCEEMWPRFWKIRMPEYVCAFQNKAPPKVAMGIQRTHLWKEKKHQNYYTSDNYIKFENHHVDEVKDLHDNHDQNTCKKKQIIDLLTFYIMGNLLQGQFILVLDNFKYKAWYFILCTTFLLLLSESLYPYMNNI
jgi:hypothetical protein